MSSDNTPCYYVSKAGETRGPTTLLALKALLKAGIPDVTIDTLVFLQGAAEWTRLEAVLVATDQTENADQPAPSLEKEIEQLDKEGEDGTGLGERQNRPKNVGKQQKRMHHANSAIYVQGLPKDATKEEVAQFFTKCGILKRDAEGPKVKLYRDSETNEPKGDALVTFVLPDSVFLAIQQFDDSDFRNGHRISVKAAEFDASGSRDVEDFKKPVGGKEAEKASRAKRARRLQERALLSWNEDSHYTKEAALLIVVLKGMFSPQVLQAGGEGALMELEEALKEGLDKVCPNGDEVKKITIFKSHPEGIILIRFKDATLALESVKLMNGRYYDGRRITAELWDGVTEYAPSGDIQKRSDEDAKRMEAYMKYIEEGDEGAQETE